jgi:CRP-like cAMP-binding protein
MLHQLPGSSGLTARSTGFNDTQEFSSDSLRQQLEMMFQTNEIRHFRRGAEIPLSPKQIWLVRHGVVQLGTLYPNGDESMIGLASPGLPFGIPLTQVNPYISVALTDVTLISLNISDVANSPVLALLFMQQFSDRLRQSEALLAISGHRRLDDRLRQLLILLAQEVGQPGKKGIRLSVRFTHQLLANATGTTRVTVTRLLGQLRREGWLEFDKTHHIVILGHEAMVAKDGFKFAA